MYSKNKILNIIIIFLIVTIIVSTIVYFSYYLLKKNIDRRFKNACDEDKTELNFSEFTDKNDVKPFVNHAMNVYKENCKSGSIIDNIENWNLLKLLKINNKDTIGYILKSKKSKDIVLSFRGSASSFDLLSGIKISQISIPYAKGKVHKGFYNYYNKFQKQIYDILDNISFDNVYITGHSMGGIFAILSSLKIFKKYQNCNIITKVFGVPKIGDDDFSNYVSEINNNNRYDLLLIMNDNDIITQLPSTNYFHPKVSFKKYYIDYGSITKNHSIDSGYNNICMENMYDVKLCNAE